MSELLTGDALTINKDEYYIRTRKGEELFLGKLLTREKFYSPFHEAYSRFNNIFHFEFPAIRTDVVPIESWHNTALFYVKSAATQHGEPLATQHGEPLAT